MRGTVGIEKELRTGVVVLAFSAVARPAAVDKVAEVLGGIVGAEFVVLAPRAFAPQESYVSATYVAAPFIITATSKRSA